MTAEASRTTRSEGLTSYFTRDHVRLDAFLARASRALASGLLEAGREAYRSFEQGLLRRLRIEEELLFPLFEARTGFRGGPTEALREEHQEIRKGLRLMHEALDCGNAADFRGGLQFLRATLTDHTAKEEHILFPTIDRLLSPDEQAALAQRLQRE